VGAEARPAGGEVGTTIDDDVRVLKDDKAEGEVGRGGGKARRARPAESNGILRINAEEGKEVGSEGRGQPYVKPKVPDRQNRREIAKRWQESGERNR